jgi:drug/metabolite transporter (DMT)-like permease
MIEIVKSGLAGAVASIFGKMSLSDKTPATEFMRYYCEVYFFYGETSRCWNMVYFVRLASFLLMFFFNAMALSKFLKALEKRGSVFVTVVSSATNFLVTGLLSGLLLGEQINAKWCFGAFLIAGGVFLIAIGQGGMSSKNNK